MIIEMPMNLKNKTKEELVSLLQDSCSIIEKQQQEIEYWKEQAEGYSGLAKQIEQDYREMEQEGIIKYE